MTSFALYEAYGTRPYEWGDDPDRQKANTKEEESDLNLLNEGMRFRDLETGIFLTRDPIGYADGPNVYCYVHCNPVTMFDPFGLSKYDPDTKTLIPDEHLNIYEMDGGNRVDHNLLVDHKKMQGMLEGAKDGYVTLPDGRKVKEDSFRNHVEVNQMILDDTAAGRSATGALENGHMSYKEAQKAEAEITSKGKSGGVKTWAEHWNVRKALNRDRALAISIGRKEIADQFRDDANDIITLPSGEVWNRASGTKYHDPKADTHWNSIKADGVDKWYTAGGRELVFAKDGSFEKRTQFMGTYNFGKEQTYGGAHKKYDIKPWKDRNKRTSPYE